MKKIFLFLFILFLPQAIFALKNRSSQSFMFTRPCHQNIPAYQAFWHNIIYDNPAEKPNSVQTLLFYQKSSEIAETHKGEQLSEYFLLRNRSVLTVQGDAIGNPNRDVRAEWLGLPSTFNGTFTVFPQQKQAGIFIDVKHDLKEQFNTELLENAWLGASISAMTVDNNLHIHQTTMPTSTNNCSIAAALSEPRIHFNQFLPKTRSSGFTDFRLTLGSQFMFRDDMQLNILSYLLIPLASQQSGRILFEAIRGFNGHIGLGFNADFQIPLTDSDSTYLIAFYLDAEDLFLLKKNEIRSIDLRNKEWSRFLLLNKRDGTQVNVPAINVLLTQKVQVKPYNIADISTGFRFKQGWLDIEVGYALWIHGNETLRLKKPFSKDWGIAAAPGEVTPEGLPATASMSTIAQQAAPDKDANGNNTFIAIEANDLFLRSGASRSSYTNRIHLAVGASDRGMCTNGMFGFGGFYEFPQNNGALQQFGFWAKLGVAF